MKPKAMPSAIENVKASVSSILNHAMRFGLDGKSVPDDLRSKIQAYLDNYVLYDHVLHEGQNPKRMEALGLTQYALDRWALAGNASDWIARIEQVAEAGATRLSPDNAWARWAAASIERSTGQRPALLPNLGGSLPNDIFADLLGLPTLWVPHSYPACAQHAPNEHLLGSVAREGLAIMAGLFWDLGDQGAALCQADRDTVSLTHP